MVDALSRRGEDTVAAEFLALTQPLPKIMQRIRLENHTQPDLSRMHALFCRGSLPTPFIVVDGLLLYNTRICIGEQLALRHELLKEYHASHTAGHTGIHRTFLRLA